MKKEHSVIISGTIPKSLYEKIKQSQGELTLSRRIKILFENGFENEMRKKNGSD